MSAGDRWYHFDSASLGRYRNAQDDYDYYKREAISQPLEAFMSPSELDSPKGMPSSPTPAHTTALDFSKDQRLLEHSGGLAYIESLQNKLREKEYQLESKDKELRRVNDSVQSLLQENQNLRSMLNKEPLRGVDLNKNSQSTDSVQGKRSSAGSPRRSSPSRNQGGSQQSGLQRRGSNNSLGTRSPGTMRRDSKGSQTRGSPRRSQQYNGHEERTSRTSRKSVLDGVVGGNERNNQVPEYQTMSQVFPPQRATIGSENPNTSQNTPRGSPGAVVYGSAGPSRISEKIAESDKKSEIDGIMYRMEPLLRNTKSPTLHNEMRELIERHMKNDGTSSRNLQPPFLDRPSSPNAHRMDQLRYRFITPQAMTLDRMKHERSLSPEPDRELPKMKPMTPAGRLPSPRSVKYADMQNPSKQYSADPIVQASLRAPTDQQSQMPGTGMPGQPVEQPQPQPQPHLQQPERQMSAFQKVMSSVGLGPKEKPVSSQGGKPSTPGSAKKDGKKTPTSGKKTPTSGKKKQNQK